MKYIAIIVLALIGLKICTIVENVMWECDRDKALGMDFKHISGKVEQ